ncbi:MAG: GatB/YqeY domain-containing protein [Dehalococcoidia bacterium]|nr:GatB/YqeY domain-containing protein [Dehalococcoidia bacterium]
MTLPEKLLEDQKAAMRSGDEPRRDALRLLRSAIGYAEIEAGHTLSDEETLAVIGKQVRQVKESIEGFQLGRRQDLIQKAERELAILLGYLPQQLAPSEIEAEAHKAIAELGAQGPRDTSKVMAVLMPRLKGRAEGREVSAVVGRLLAGASGSPAGRSP